MSNRGVQLAITLFIGLVIGAFAGRLTAPSPSATSPAERATPARPGPGSVAKIMERVAEVAGADEDSGLLPIAEDVLGSVGVSDLLDWGRAPEEVSRRVINEMSDAELITTITSVTKIDAEDLAEYSDLRDYANRLTHVALSGIITPDIAEEFGHDTLDVEFGTGASSSYGADDPRFEFDEMARKIYAVIPNHEDAGKNVMVHWYRIDEPENLLFDKYRVNPNDDYSYVWLKSPGRWGIGEYRVEFFSADEYLTPMASGTYSVVAK